MVMNTWLSMAVMIIGGVLLLVVIRLVVAQLNPRRWQWYDIASYKVSIGGTDHYGGIQLLGRRFYALLKFHPAGTLPDAVTLYQQGQRFYGHLDFQQLPRVVDLLRQEKPIRFGWSVADPNCFHLMTGAEPVGEGDGFSFQL
jgi:hypothetical protein